MTKLIIRKKEYKTMFRLDVHVRNVQSILSATYRLFSYLLTDSIFIRIRSTSKIERCRYDSISEMCGSRHAHPLPLILFYAPISIRTLAVLALTL